MRFHREKNQNDDQLLIISTFPEKDYNRHSFALYGEKVE